MIGLGESMSDTSVFLSSTMGDLNEVRTKVANFIRDAGMTAVTSETGSIPYDPAKPLDESCYQKVQECDFFVMIVGGRYGSAASSNQPARQRPDKRKQDRNRREKPASYRSIVSEEYRAARAAGIPIYAFVKASVFNELATFRTNRKNPDVQYAHVDSVKIFELIEEIQGAGGNNIIHTFGSADEIIAFLRKQWSLILKDYAKAKRQEIAGSRSGQKQNLIPINPYKLFYHRSTRGLTFNKLAAKSGVPQVELHRAEKGFDPSATPRPAINPADFPRLDSAYITRIAQALGVSEKLKGGAEDDLHSVYLTHWASYKGRRLSRSDIRDQPQTRFQTNIVVLDFDGTLTSTEHGRTTWELLWMEAGYPLDRAKKYHKQFREGQLTHSEWCAVTLKAFKEKEVSRKTCDAVVRKTLLLDGVGETLRELKDRGKKIYILSGSIRYLIDAVLGDYVKYFDGISANEFHFSDDGKLAEIRGTEYDFKTKADYIKKIIAERKCNPLDVLYVGNSCNDIFVSGAGARTLCINDRETDPGEPKWWTYHESEVKNFRRVLEYMHLEGPLIDTSDED